MKRTICLILSLLLASHLLPAGDVLHLNTVVIDAGHGGKDPGAVSADRKTYEKNIVLDVAQKLAASIRSAYPDVSVIMTRDKDEFIPLNNRADIANKANANLFISIHVNAARNTSASGFSLHVMGQSRNKGTDLYELNMESVMRENSVIQLEDNASASYEGFDPSDPESYIFLQLMQNAYLEQSLAFAQTVKDNLHGGIIDKDRGIWQNPFLVLWKTSMPAVLIEIGFISNTADLSKLRLASTRDDIAQRLFKAFREYKESYDRSLNSQIEPTPPVRYGIQIFALSSKVKCDLSTFKSQKPEVFEAGALKKYVVAISDSLSVTRAELIEIKKKYPDAFLVKIDCGVLSAVKIE